ncbi:hypothetical protein GCM10029963_28490 [Micromonospora andamanensis]|uniref:hypothetical protein n=1 Tax=Micromonospora andamanensis TaxID=1287068 RepID=UPI00194E9EB9|nr:hypothetical protein [Micromonospora andamanensis]GIJ38518.1 hypothetical protein Vwe01_18430 [Micromonospora andamanensis]
MPIPSLPGFTAGEKVTAAKLNEHTKGAFESAVYFKPFCLLHQTAGQSVPTGTTAATMSLNAIVEDSDNMADLANNRIVIRTAGLYRFTGQVPFVTNGTGHRALRLYIGGGTSKAEVTMNAVTAAESRLNASFYWRCSVGLSFTAGIVQTSGSALSTSTSGSPGFICAEWVSM